MAGRQLAPQGETALWRVAGNGFEMWRWLYQEFQGGSEAVMLGGSRRLQDFPRCTKLDQLSAHLDVWTECLNTYCTELLHAPGVLRSMLWGVIPSDFEDELLINPHVKSWQDIIQWCKIKTVYKRQKTPSRTGMETWCKGQCGLGKH